MINMILVLYGITLTSVAVHAIITSHKLSYLEELVHKLEYKCRGLC